jgi:hypothetical protein
MKGVWDVYIGRSCVKPHVRDHPHHYRAQQHCAVIDENIDVQEIPTPQGFLVIQICMSIARAMNTSAPLIDNRRAKSSAASALIKL